MEKFDPVLFAKALADETRQKIMKICCCEWLSVNEIGTFGSNFLSCLIYQSVLTRLKFTNRTSRRTPYAS